MLKCLWLYNSGKNTIGYLLHHGIYVLLIKQHLIFFLRLRKVCLVTPAVLITLYQDIWKFRVVTFQQKFQLMFGYRELGVYWVCIKTSFCQII